MNNSIENIKMVFRTIEQKFNRTIGWFFINGRKSIKDYNDPLLKA